MIRRKNLPRSLRIVRSQDGITWEKTRHTFSRPYLAIKRLMEFNKDTGWKYRIQHIIPKIKK